MTAAAAEPDKCIGSGRCSETCPEVFDQTADQGIVMIKVATVPADSLEKARRAVEQCPTQAIWLVE